MPKKPSKKNLPPSSGGPAEAFSRHTGIDPDKINHWLEIVRAQDRLDSEAVLHQLQTRVKDLSDVLDHIGAYVFIKDLQGRYTYANRLARELLNRSLEEILGRDDSHFFSADTVADIYRHDREVLQHGKTISDEERLIPNGRGEMRVYWTVKMPLHDDKGNIRGLCGISTDITDRIRMEEALRANQTLLATVLDNIRACIYMKAPDGRYLYANQALGELLQRHPASLIGLRDENLFTIEASVHFRHLDAQAMASGSKVEGMETFRLGDGRDRFYWSVKMPLFSENGTMYAMLGMSTDITERKHLEDELLRLATTDDLTRLSNRRHFLEQAESTLSRSRRYNEPLSLLMCDIDLFKHINDTFGHAVGDRALCRVADIIRSSLRDTDLAGRIGGEEFAILLVQTPPEQAHDVAERLRQAIESAPLVQDGGSQVNLTISIGIASPAYPVETLATLLQHADQALYAAKREGRNRVCQA
ncbi:PAS domain S-box-containing protein/diguanylate cyclase (GGDEF)-like protein [Fluviicoccus keumensis]|uniref:PAS domain S-box-containing protein/diguanylate cyclase (GGDEF)-like protein n=1 Tax=Fluviicoccus keumensis TaxID=1435465 RepID=A0A4Q7ZA79_9GAMM|nr:diguanylate cyclase [Fluviicoccus keumensis]RZU46795.1 PAS domain S-box-containing protein/diguanylate cyclase (GGDEF)-like protein [Fluviicoccus keumensis]